MGAVHTKGVTVQPRRLLRHQLDEYNIPIDFKVTNKNDAKAMGAMVRRAKTILGHPEFTAIFDKGYHTGSEFDCAHKHEVEAIVAVPAVASHAP
jgi:hypothetical protein